jgi:hypothetical protein
MAGSDALGCFLLQLKCDLLVCAYLFRNAQNCEDAAERLQRFVHWKVSFEETFHRGFVILALNVYRLRDKSKPYRFSSFVI